MPTKTVKKSQSGAEAPALDHKVKDLALASWGRKEIDLAEKEMPGLMAVRKEFARRRPLSGRESPALST